MFDLSKVLGFFSGNRFVQEMLMMNVRMSQFLMGIGSGSGVRFSSGEKVIFDILNKTIKPPFCVFDVGSNKGQFLQLIVDSVLTDNFFVHGFEPAQETYRQLVQNFGKDKRICLNNLAVGRDNGQTVLYYDKPGSGLASLTKRKLDHFGIDFNISETVSITTIDHYCSEYNIGRINLLKMDVEGHELDVLAGAATKFDNNQIDMVTFEFGGCNIDTRTFFQDFWYFFLKTNLKLFRITPSGYLSPIEKYREIDEQFRATNFIAIRKN